MATGDVNYLDTISLGKIIRWESKKIANITPIPFPGQNEGKTEGIDTLGIIRYLVFSGRFTGVATGSVSPFESIQNTLYGIQSILDGAQISAVKLYSPFVNGVDGNGNRRQGAQGSTTATTSNKLVDSTASFITDGIQIDDKVKNLVDGEVTTVSGIDSETTLSLSADKFVSGQAYAVSANIYVKLLSLETRWELPGLSYCDYTISVMQVVS